MPFCGSVWDYGCQHATYNVHLVRDLTFLSEEQQQNWAEQMKDLMLPMKAAVEQAHAERVGRQVTLAMGNFADPILKPWAADAMRQSNEEVLSGQRG